MKDEDYFSDHSRVSNSGLSLLKESPELYWQMINGEYKRPVTKAMEFGTLVHCLVLESSKFSERYYILPEGIDRRTNAGRAAYDEALYVAGKKTVITRETIQDALACAKRIRSNETIGKTLETPDVEIERVTYYRLFGLDFRSKLDWVDPRRKLIIDIKTCRNASPKAFAIHAAKLGYHRQGALYCEGASQVWGGQFRFVMVCVCTTYPYETSVVEWDDYGLLRGMQDAAALCEQLKIRTLTDNWKPDYSKGPAPTKITVPKWLERPEMEDLFFKDLLEGQDNE